MRALSLVPLLLVVLTGIASAKNPALPRERANIHVIGKVQRVYESVEKGHIQNITEIRVQQVKSGQGVKKGQTLYIWSFQWKDDGAKRLRTGTAHGAPPKKGQLIEAWAYAGASTNHGAKPKWFDVLPEDK